MSDFPKCIECLIKHKTGQTYKLLGTNTYYCQSCKKQIDGATFDPLEFEWKNKDKQTEYNTFMKSKGVNVPIAL